MKLQLALTLNVCRLVFSPTEQRDMIQQIRVKIKDIMMKAKNPSDITTQYVRKHRLCCVFIMLIIPRLSCATEILWHYWLCFPPVETCTSYSQLLWISSFLNNLTKLFTGFPAFSFTFGPHQLSSAKCNYFWFSYYPVYTLKAVKACFYLYF